MNKGREMQHKEWKGKGEQRIGRNGQGRTGRKGKANERRIR